MITIINQMKLVAELVYFECRAQNEIIWELLPLKQRQTIANKNWLQSAQNLDSRRFSGLATPASILFPMTTETMLARKLSCFDGKINA